MAVENARLSTERSRIAGTFQGRLLPPELPDVPGSRLAARTGRRARRTRWAGTPTTPSRGPAAGSSGRRRHQTGCRGGRADVALPVHAQHRRPAAWDPVAALGHLDAALRERPGVSLVSVSCVLLRMRTGAVSGDRARGEPLPFTCIRSGLSPSVQCVRAVPGGPGPRHYEAMTVELDRRRPARALHRRGGRRGREDRALRQKRLAAALRDVRSRRDITRIDERVT